MNLRHLNPDPVVQKKLDLLKLRIGFGTYFVRGVDEISTEPGTSLTRAGYVLRNAVGYLEQLAKDPTKMQPVKHQDAKTMYDRMTVGMKAAPKNAARWAEREMNSARDNMAAVLSKDSSKD